MRACLVAIGLMGLLLSVAGPASAETLTFHDEWNGRVNIDNSTSLPYWWSPKLDFPGGDTKTTSQYANGIFEYDDYINSLEYFTITIRGYGDNSNKPIDLFVDFNADHELPEWRTVKTCTFSIFGICFDYDRQQVNIGGDGWLESDERNYGKIAGYDVPTSQEFELTMDVLNGKFYYDKVNDNVAPKIVATSLNYLTPDTFLGSDAFYLGVGCHFTLTDIAVDLGVFRESPPPMTHAPEPGSLILLGSGIMALGLIARRKRK